MMYCSYATEGGHALVGAAIYLPAGQCGDPECRAAMGVPDEVVFRTKTQLAQDILTDLIADATIPPLGAATRSTAGRDDYESSCKTTGSGMSRGSAVPSTSRSRPENIRADAAVARFVAKAAWQTCSVTGSTGERRYAWAWIATASPRHYLLIRKHRTTAELAYDGGCRASRVVGAGCGPCITPP